jgi:hypothetical protein
MVCTEDIKGVTIAKRVLDEQCEIE